MPRLSLWREDKGNDYHFIDGVVKEQFLVGGTGILIHKYLGPQETGPSDDPSQPNNQASGTTNETSIQDVLFLENREYMEQLSIESLEETKERKNQN